MTIKKMYSPVVYICNALDEQTKFARNIKSDSPAATNKVISLTKAMQKAGLKTIILSIARGRQNTSGHTYRCKVTRFDGCIFIYCEFWHIPIITHFVTIISLAIVVTRLISKYNKINLLVYNRSYHYILGLIFARLRQAKVFIDLEDGYNNDDRDFINQLQNNLTKYLFNWLCPSGAIIANTALAKQIRYSSPFVCYGVVENKYLTLPDWSEPKIRLIFSGTLLEEVGSKLIVSALDLLRIKYPYLFNKLHFVVTGKGPCSEIFKKYAYQYPEWMSFHSDLSRENYLICLRACHVGLSLRLALYGMSQTTFPSKVIEYAQSGLLVLTTKASDVPDIFRDGAIYLDDETPEALARLIADLPKRKLELQFLADIGRARVLEVCDQENVGHKLRQIFCDKV